MISMKNTDEFSETKNTGTTIGRLNRFRLGEKSMAAAGLPIALAKEDAARRDEMLAEAFVLLRKCGAQVTFLGCSNEIQIIWDSIEISNDGEQVKFVVDGKDLSHLIFSLSVAFATGQFPRIAPLFGIAPWTVNEDLNGVQMKQRLVEHRQEKKHE